jgi:hypothetical protein
MADESQLKILKQGVAAWNEWCRDEEFHLIGANLRGPTAAGVISARPHRDGNTCACSCSLACKTRTRQVNLKTFCGHSLRRCRTVCDRRCRLADRSQPRRARLLLRSCVPIPPGASCSPLECCTYRTSGSPDTPKRFGAGCPGQARQAPRGVVRCRECTRAARVGLLDSDRAAARRKLLVGRPTLRRNRPWHLPPCPEVCVKAALAAGSGGAQICGDRCGE